MKYISIFGLILIVFSCNTNSDKEKQILNNEKEVVEEVSIPENSTEDSIEVIVEKEQELTPFQKAVSKHKDKDIFPQRLVFQDNEDIFEVEALEFIAILKNTENWFLSKYIRSEGETEEVYFFTFDYIGNQLDVKHIYTLAIDLNAKIFFKDDNQFEIIKKIDEVELDENDHLKIISTREKKEKYTISKNGKILLLH